MGRGQGEGEEKGCSHRALFRGECPLFHVVSVKCYHSSMEREICVDSGVRRGIAHLARANERLSGTPSFEAEELVAIEARAALSTLIDTTEQNGTGG